LHFQIGFSCGAIVTLEIFAGRVANFRQLERGPLGAWLGNLPLARHGRERPEAGRKNIVTVTVAVII
jgi:hypothetical protein